LARRRVLGGRAHEVMTGAVAEAVQCRAPEIAEAAMTADIAGRHQDIREPLSSGPWAALIPVIFRQERHSRLESAADSCLNWGRSSAEGIA
jgi:hypothetical protein